MSYAVDVSELPTWELVDQESSGWVDGVGVGPCSFVFAGFSYRLTRGVEDDPLPEFRGMVPCNSAGQYIRLPDPHWYYWDGERGRWTEHPWPPSVAGPETAVVVPIREGIVVEDGEELSFTEMLDEALMRLGGVGFIMDVARSNPLEFLKLRARTISVDLKQIGGGDVSVTVNTVGGVEDYKDADVVDE